MCNTAIPRSNHEPYFTRLRLSDQHRDEFRNKLTSNIPILNSFSDELDYNNTATIDDFISKLSKLINEAGDPLFSKTIKGGQINYKSIPLKKAACLITSAA